MTNATKEASEVSMNEGNHSPLTYELQNIQSAYELNEWESLTPNKQAYMAEHLAGENFHNSPIEFNKKEIKKLKNLLGLLEKTSSPSTCILTFSNISSQNSKASGMFTKTSWVIDLGGYKSHDQLLKKIYYLQVLPKE